MLSIYLCEDDQKQLNIWKDILKKYIIINEIPAKITFSNRQSRTTFSRVEEEYTCYGIILFGCGITR